MRPVPGEAPSRPTLRACARLPLRIIRAVLLRSLLGLRFLTLRFYSRARLARVGREHHVAAVRRRAWELNGAFVVGEGTNINWHVSAVVQRWGQRAASLGERVAVAPGVTFVAASAPDFSRLRQLDGFDDRFVRYAPITVGDDTWIGASATLLPGVTIGKCCLIGAGAVVTRVVPDYAIAAGVPARVIGDVREGGGTPPEGPAP